MCIMISGLLDGLDGPTARLLNGTSRFGAEFDSLSDYVNFGVTPALLMYFWSLNQSGFIGWIVTLVYTICMGARLARFNAGIDFNASKLTRSFFMGIPAPAGAMLMVLPMIISFYFKKTNFFVGKQILIDLKKPIITIPYVILVAYLLVSRLPTFSTKGIHRELFKKITLLQFILFLVIGCFFIFMLIYNFWLSLIIFWVCYLFCIPISYTLFQILSLQQRNKLK
jgi:CDP-diacylglycerol--serine O-phosphatidyltransferase